MNIVEVIRTETAALREKTAVVDGTVEISYGRLLDAVDQAAGVLAKAGVAPLQRVAFLCEDGVDYIIGSLAILRLGAVVVPVSPSLMGDELESVLDRMDADALLYDTGVHQREGGQTVQTSAFVVRAFALAIRDSSLYGLGGKVCDHSRPTETNTIAQTVGREWLRSRNLPAAYRDLNPAFIRFSSGTTGESKGVLLSHETILERTDAADKALLITSADTIVWVLSMSFHFVVTILLYLRRGATVLICRQPFPDSFLDAAQRHRGTVFYASPFHYHALATSPLVSAASLNGVRLAISTAMKLPAETADAFAQKFGFELAEAYGIIEVGLPFVNAAGKAKRGSVGRILPDYQLRIASPDADGRGAIQLRGKGLFDAYVSPWKRRDDALSDGWFNTGDLGRLDSHGYLYIEGREKEVINFAGMKVFPYEVEEILIRHPAVAEALVYGEPHSLYGQIPCARIVLRSGFPNPDPIELRRFCFERLAPHKVPKAFEVVESLDRTASGKLKR
jgi:long-chain acyl-CoA synthetase